MVICGQSNNLRPAAHIPLLTLGVRLLGGGIVHVCSADGSRGEEARGGHVHAAGAMGADGAAGGDLAEGILTVALAQVATAPYAGADPDARDTEDHDDDEDNPLPVTGEPCAATVLVVPAPTTAS